MARRCGDGRADAGATPAPPLMPPTIMITATGAQVIRHRTGEVGLQHHPARRCRTRKHARRAGCRSGRCASSPVFLEMLSAKYNARRRPWRPPRAGWSEAPDARSSGWHGCAAGADAGDQHQSQQDDGHEQGRARQRAWKRLVVDPRRSNIMAQRPRMAQMPWRLM